MSPKLRVLIVEDRESDAKLMVSELRRTGFDVEWVRVDSEEDFVARVSELFDLILSDYRMPQFDGLRALHLMQEHNVEIPFIFVSGVIGEDIAVKAMVEGAADYLLKDRLARLGPAVQRVLEQKLLRNKSRQNEAAIKASELRYRTIVESALDCIIVIDDAGRILEFNPAAERVFGFSREEIVGSELAESLVPLQYRAAHRAGLQRYLSQGESRILDRRLELRALRKSGEEFPVELSVSSNRDRPQTFTGFLRDITDRKRAEAKLQDNEARLVRAQAVGRIGSWETELPTLRVTWSDETYHIFEIQPDQMQITHQRFLELVHPEDRAVVDNAFVQSLSHRSPCSITHRVVTPDGRIKFLEECWQTQEDDRGEPVRVVGTCQDVTQRKLAEDALRESETFNRSLMEASADCIKVLDLDGLLLHMNGPGLCLMELDDFGSMCGQAWKELWPVDMRAEIDRAITTAKGGTVHMFQGFCPTAKGTPRWWEVTVSPVRDTADGKVVRLLVVSHNITERKRAEAERTELLARMNLEVERMPLAYLLSGPDFRYTRWNPAAERTFGFTEAEVLGKHPFGVVVPKQSQNVVAGLFDRLAAGDMSAHGTCENVTKDGRTIYCEWHNTPLTSNDGTFHGILSVAQDITARKLLEEQLRQSQKMEAFGQLAGGVAHDFNNLLTIINSYSEIVFSSLSADDPLRQAAREISSAGERAAALTRQLLAFSRKQVVEMSVLNINTVLTATVTMLRRLIGEDVQLEFVAEPKLKHVRADRSQLEQILINLAVNARDAMPTGGKLTIETTNAELDETHTQTYVGLHPGPYVVLAVSDTGCGMDAATQSRIFEPFFTTKELGKGTGLGLATVFGIVSQMGGSIFVDSESGCGATFRIYLPAADEPTSADRSNAQKKLDDRGDETILVVEDEPILRQLARHILEAKGYTILEACHGADAIQFVKQHTAVLHLVVTDVVMPVMGGREMAERLHELRPDLKVLYLSGYTDDAILRQGILQEESYFLQKPFTPTSLAQKVREVLDELPETRRNRLNTGS